MLRTDEQRLQGCFVSELTLSICCDAHLNMPFKASTQLRTLFPATAAVYRHRRSHGDILVAIRKLEGRDKGRA
jgi:hypothetical protein